MLAFASLGFPTTLPPGLGTGGFGLDARNSGPQLPSTRGLTLETLAQAERKAGEKLARKEKKKKKGKNKGRGRLRRHLGRREGKQGSEMGRKEGSEWGKEATGKDCGGGGNNPEGGSLTSCPKASLSEAPGVASSTKPKPPVFPHLSFFLRVKMMLFADWTLLRSSGCQNTAHKTQFHTKNEANQVN